MKLSRRILNPFAAGLASACFAAQAASHREAPLIALDPAADLTDVYAFVSYDDEHLKRAPADRRVTFVMNVNPGRTRLTDPTTSTSPTMWCIA